MNDLSRFFPWLVAGSAVLFFGFEALPPSSGPDQMQIEEFGAIPVIDRGRVKPIDTSARTTLMLISGRQEFMDESDKLQPAIKWLLDVVTSRAPTEGVRIDNDKLLDLLGLKPTPGGRYDVDEFTDKLPALADQMMRVQKLEPGQRDDYDTAILQLAVQLRLHFELDVSGKKAGAAEKYKVFRIDNDQLLGLLGLKPRSGFRYAIDEFRGQIREFDREFRRAQDVDEDHRTLYERKVVELGSHLHSYMELSSLRGLLIVPPQAAGQQWQPLREAVAESVITGRKDADALALRDILKAYGKGDAKTFNEEVASYRERVAGLAPVQSNSAGLEVFFNNFAPFYWCMVLYVVVFLLACVSWVAWREPLNRAAFYLALVTLVVHTFALVARMWLQGRPPVTNLYSSAVFVGWLCVILCLVLERIFGNGIGNVVAAGVGFVTMHFAHHLAASGDTLEMMQAVLDTNFWLATHVTCVTAGYASTLVAGSLGLLFIFLGVVTRALDKPMFKSLGQAMYGILCFATLLSFTGTVLGGIWADQSWGRFWGWDPKENGALLIVVWNALILHARWGGMVKQRGMAVLAVVGNIITGWSWVGTNQLGVGLHAYGFNKTLTDMLLGFWGLNALVFCLGVLPLRYWRSFAPAARQERGKDVDPTLALEA